MRAMPQTLSLEVKLTTDQRRSKRDMQQAITSGREYRFYLSFGYESLWRLPIKNRFGVLR